MKKIIVSLMSSIVLLSAGECKLSQVGDVDVTWKAFKTPAKIGVGGNFKSVTYTNAIKEGTNFKKLLVGATVAIDTHSVFSNNSGRDVKLVKFFFDGMQGATIKGKIVDVISDKMEKGKPKTGTFVVEVTMNSITKKVPMKFSFSEGYLHANGIIDLFDFNGASALSAITKACFDLHKGKTWNDVNIGFKMGIKASCTK